MKKYTLFLFVLTFLLVGFNVNSANAQVAQNTGFTSGCTSTRGYSPTTGEKCAILVYASLPAGCTSTLGYSPITGIKCETGHVSAALPDGCTSTSGYSPLTGLKCDSSTISTQPSITVLSPNGGEIWQVGSTQTIKWSLKGNLYPQTCIYLKSLDTGAEYYGLVNNCLPSTTTSYAWTVDLSDFPPSASGYKILVQNNGRYEGDSGVRDYSDNSFIINSGTTFPPGCTSTSGYSSHTGLRCDVSSQSPVISGVSGPQSLNVNQQGTWSVKASNLNGGNLSYSVDWKDTNYATFSYPTSPVPLQSATFTHSYSQAGIYKPTFTVTSENTIRCITTPCPSNGGTAQTSLSVNVGNTATSSIDVWSPDKGDSWAKGTTQTITYTDTNNISTHEIKLIPFHFPCTSGPYTICPAYSYQAPYTIANTQALSFSWKVGQTWENPSVPEGMYIIQVCQTGTTVCGSSHSYFTLTSGNTQPSITVLSPNGGESYVAGSSYAIRWNASNFPANSTVYFELRPDNFNIGSGVTKIASVSPASGYYLWQIPTNINSAQYKIEAYQGDQAGEIDQNGSAKDKSDSFTITSPTTSPKLTVSQNAGYASQYVNPNTTNVKIGSYTLQNSTGNENVSITQLTINISGSTSLTNLSNLRTSETSGAGSYPIQPSAGNTIAVDFGLASGSGRTIDIFADIGNATGTIQTALDVIGVGSASGNSVSSYPFVNGQTLKLNSFTITSPVSTQPSITIYGPWVVRTQSAIVYVGQQAQFTSTSGGAFTYNCGGGTLSGVTTAGTFYCTYSSAGQKTVYIMNSNTLLAQKSFAVSTPITSSPSPSPSSSPSPSPSPSPSVLGTESFHFTQYLKEGSSGNEVTELQKFLNGAGYDLGNVDGNFGPKTKEALIQIQTANGLKNDGIVGFEVRSFLNK